MDTKINKPQFQMFFEVAITENNLVHQVMRSKFSNLRDNKAPKLCRLL